MSLGTINSVFLISQFIDSNVTGGFIYIKLTTKSES